MECMKDNRRGLQKIIGEESPSNDEFAKAAMLPVGPLNDPFFQYPTTFSLGPDGYWQQVIPPRIARFEDRGSKSRAHRATVAAWRKVGVEEEEDKAAKFGEESGKVGDGAAKAKAKAEAKAKAKAAAEAKANTKAGSEAKAKADAEAKARGGPSVYPAGKTLPVEDL